MRDNAMSRVAPMEISTDEWICYHIYTFTEVHDIGGPYYLQHLKRIFFDNSSPIPLRILMQWWYKGFCRSGVYSRTLD